MVGGLSGGPVVPPRGGVRRCCPSPSVGAALSSLPPSVVGRLLQHRLSLGGAAGRRPYFNFAAQMRRQALTRHLQRGWVRLRSPPCPPSLRFADAMRRAGGRGAVRVCCVPPGRFSPSHPRFSSPLGKRRARCLRLGRCPLLPLAAFPRQDQAMRPAHEHDSRRVKTSLAALRGLDPPAVSMTAPGHFWVLTLSYIRANMIRRCLSWARKRSTRWVSVGG